MGLPATLVVATLLNGWLGAELDAQPGCLRVSHVWPAGPAAVAGLEEGDCIDSLSLGDRPIPAASALEVVVGVRGGTLLRAQLRRGKTVVVKVVEPEKELLLEYCKWRQTRRTRISVVVFRPGEHELHDLLFEAAPTVGEVRRRAGVSTVARVDLKTDCSGRTTASIARAADALVIRGDATVSFGEAPPTFMYVLQCDGDSCRAPAPRYRADGGIELEAAMTDCSTVEPGQR